jgi:hypothetical protein
MWAFMFTKFILLPLLLLLSCLFPSSREIINGRWSCFLQECFAIVTLLVFPGAVLRDIPQAGCFSTDTASELGDCLGIPTIVREW